MWWLGFSLSQGRVTAWQGVVLAAAAHLIKDAEHCVAKLKGCT